MKKILKLFSIASLGFIFTTAHADDSAQTLSRLLDTTESMQASFKESVMNKKGRAISQAEGKMSLKRPGKFRWEVTAPNAQLIVTNGKKLWVYDRDLEQVTVHSLANDSSEAPAFLLSHSGTSVTDKFQVKIKQDAGLQWFLLTPKDSNSMFTLIELGFANQEIKKMQLRDHLGNVTEIDFSRINLNENLADNLFLFTAPKGVDVLDETKR